MHVANCSLPFGGVGASGIGSYHGENGFESFSHSKSIIDKPTWFEPFLKYPPYTKYKILADEISYEVVLLQASKKIIFVWKILGLLAQLVLGYLDTVGVSGSTPLESTNYNLIQQPKTKYN